MVKSIRRLWIGSMVGEVERAVVFDAILRRPEEEGRQVLVEHGCLLLYPGRELLVVAQVGRAITARRKRGAAKSRFAPAFPW